MKRMISHIKQHPIMYSVLFILALLTIFFFSLWQIKTAEHYARLENAVSVNGIVTDCQYKEVKKREHIGDEWYWDTEHYYIVSVEYEYGGRTYMWTYQSDDHIPQGQTQRLTVDLNDPEYVLNDGNPGSVPLVFGIVCTVIIMLIVSIWIFGANAIFAMFVLAAVGFLIGTVMTFTSSKGLCLAFFSGFVVHSAVSCLLFKCCISKNKKTGDSSPS